MRIAVIGTGAVGGYCAARLWNAGHTVYVVDIGEHLAAIAARGLRVFSLDAEFVVHPVVAAETAAIGPVDLVIVSVQSQDTARVAGHLRPLLNANTVVVPLQNNVDNPAKLAAALGADSVVGAAIFIAAARTRPGEVRLLAEQVSITIGELNGHASERMHWLADVLNSAGLPCAVSQHIMKEMWHKYIFVVGFYLTAPLRATAAEVLELEETRALHRRLLQELVDVATIQGIQLDETDLNKIIAATRHYGGYLPSVVQEIDEGSADEVEHMLNTAIDMGRAGGRSMTTAMDILAFSRFINQRNRRRRAKQLG